MPFNNIPQLILPPQNGTAPHVTGSFGEPRGDKNHGGVDINYVGGQSGINLTHPTIHSPISGTIEMPPNGGQYGTIGIRDQYGNLHQILHTNSQLVTNGQEINAGDPIGTMGGTGPSGADEYDQHVHYQLRDPSGKIINPETWGCPEFCVNGFSINSMKSVLQTGWRSGLAQLSSPGLASSTSC